VTSFLTSLDAGVLDALFAHRELSTAQALMGITELGGALFVGGLTLCIGLFLVVGRRYGHLASLAVCVGGAAGATLLLKHVVARARPDVAYQVYVETGFSFPSAHAALAVALYGFCIYLAWRVLPVPMWRITITFLLGLLILAIAFSRLYLGVHYLSDVVGGLALGSLFVWIGIAIARKLERGN
jgi:undecaprenyl-diphosphatase